MFDVWYDLPRPLRIVLGLVCMGLGVLVWYMSHGTFYMIGLGAVGLVMILFSGAGGSGNGYNF